MEDLIEATESLHQPDNEELHFRFMGSAKRRSFVVNVQFAVAEDGSDEKLLPVEYDFMIAKVLRLILQSLGERPNPALH